MPKKPQVALVSSHVHSLLLKTVNKMSNLKYYPEVFMLGKDSTGIIRDAIMLTRIPGQGCSEMPSIDNTSLSKAYIRLAKRGFIPCGYARAHYQFGGDSSGKWRDTSGRAIFHSGDYMLSVSKRSFVAQQSIGKSLRTVTVELTNK